MSTPPTGTVTFLFTDIEGSTKLAQEYPERWESLRARHHAILKSAMDAHNGHVFQIIGDAFCVAFHTTSDGLNGAIDAQRQLQNENWGETPIKVRMGIHTGEAEKRENDYRGYLTMAKVQRVMSVAYGRQVLLSNASAELLLGKLPEGITLRDMKEHSLKGLPKPEHLWQMVAPNLPQDFPPLQSLKETPNNLPVQITSFIGRENEIAEVKQELESHRLVTLIGSGGTGKTRLSLQVAADLLEKFDHGVWFVELAPLTDPDLIPQTILSAIGVQEQQGKTPLEVLKEYLHEKQALIVLDNCEHLISASAQVVNTLLNAAPKLKVLASSREALGVKGEVSYPVPSLLLPDIKHLPGIEQLSQYEAVRLFIDRALLVAPHFVVNKDNAPHIAQICHRLDGIPLAIELAAARVKMMSVEQISKRLDDRFRLLTGGARTALPRQQTLRALIDWSYDLLSENERLLLCRFCVFAGGWTLEAAEEVCSDQPSVNSEKPEATDHRLLITDILDVLTQLVNKSLVVVIEHSQSGETRYRMLETIRQYAREKLLEAGGSEVIRDKHLAYFVNLAEQAEPELIRSNQVFWLNRLDDELDNLRIALEWALERNVEAGLRIATVLWQFWQSRGYLAELGNWLGQLLKHYEIANSLHVRALAAYSIYTRSRSIAEQSLQMARTLSDRQSEALSLMNLGVIISVQQGDLREGLPVVEQSLALFRELGDTLNQAYATGWLSLNNNDLEHTKALVIESLRLFRQLGHLWGIASSLRQLATLTIWGGDFSSPTQWLEEARTIFRQLGDQLREAQILELYGGLAFWMGDFQKACAYYEEAITLEKKVGSDLDSDWTHTHMAYAVLRQGDITQAKEKFKFCVQHFQNTENIGGLVFAMEGLASLNINQDQPERAAQLFAWADAMREKLNDYRPPVEQASVERDLAVIHSKVNEAEYVELCAQGQAMTIERAVTLVLED